MIEIWSPPQGPARASLAAPVAEVTLLEDRAMVTRRGQLELAPGSHRLRVQGVAPVAQDVSVRAACTSANGRVTDAHLRRALRSRRQDRPEERQRIDAKIRALEGQLSRRSADRARAERRLATVADMLQKGSVEIPVDAAWGRVDPEGWSATFHRLFTKGRALQAQAVEAYLDQRALDEDLLAARRARHLLDRQDHHFGAWVDIDVVVTEAGPVALELRYIVPNALWRPIHRARLHEGVLSFTSQATVWQRTGEDWTEAQLLFSTARASLGTDPPLLRDDLLEATRRREQVTLEAREVAIQRPEGAQGAPASQVQLPGVDDGGEVRTLRAEHATSVPSDGRPVVVPLFRFESPATVRHVSVPSEELAVLLASSQHHTGSSPILAGPVELLLDTGVVGWSELLFVAPGQPFSLSFGPAESLRVSRQSKRGERKVHPIDKWTRRTTSVALFLSNLGPAPLTVELTERVPVSEVEEVRVELLDTTTDDPTLDEHGMVRWTLELPPHSQRKVSLVWRLEVAPGVEGLR